MNNKTKVQIIAEAGVNHNGNLNIAKQLIDVAARSGADLIKFQTFKAERLVSDAARKAIYQARNARSSKAETQLAMLRRLELSETNHDELIAYCEQRGIGFFSSAFDMESLDYLNNIGCTQFKIPSGEITNLPFLRKVASYRRNVIMSTGMARLGEIEEAIEALEIAGLPRNRVTLLHCTTEYPAPLEEVNLHAMQNLGQTFGVPVGYSDHTEGIEVALAAASLGATIIEKHFTLDRGMPGPDHAASLEPEELQSMVRGIRKIEIALGHAQKRRTQSEQNNMEVARKSIVAACTIPEGTPFSEENLATKRPATGLSPMLWDSVIGRLASRDFQEGEEVQL